ncbi:MAG TPA: DNA adenine methylase, partial [Polyangia bacterium]
MPAALTAAVRTRAADVVPRPKRAPAAGRGKPIALPPVARPFLKWAGGKQQLLPAFAALYPAADETAGYHEPFVGSGAVFFDVRGRFSRRRCTLSDQNPELSATFTAVRDDAEALIAALLEHRP